MKAIWVDGLAGDMPGRCRPSPRRAHPGRRHARPSLSSQNEAQSAHDASRSLGVDPNRRIAAVAGESPETERVREDQQKLSHYKADEAKGQKNEMTFEEEVIARSNAARARIAQDKDDEEDEDE
jgi:hypothetical protein